MKKIFFFTGLAVPFLCVAAASLYVNPYCVISQCNDWDMLIPSKYDRTMIRTTMAYVVGHLKPEAVVLGTSRAKFLDKKHPGWHVQPVLNAAVPGASMFEIRRLFEHIQMIHPLKKMVLVLDYPYFNVKEAEGFVDGRFLRVTKPTRITEYYSTVAQDYYIELFSSNSFARIINVLFPLPPKWRGNLERYSLNKYKSRSSQVSNASAGQEGGPFAELKTIIAIAAENAIDAIFVLPPFPVRNHPDFLYTETYFQWERDIVALLEKTATTYGKRFDLWDFSDYNAVTAGENWFGDEFHFNPLGGTLMLNRIFHTCDDRCDDVPGNFGVKITQENIERHIRKMRVDDKNFKREHPEMMKK